MWQFDPWFYSFRSHLRGAPLWVAVWLRQWSMCVDPRVVSFECHVGGRENLKIFLKRCTPIWVEVYCQRVLRVSCRVFVLLSLREGKRVPQTVRSLPEPKSRVRHSTDRAIQVPGVVVLKSIFSIISDLLKT